MKSFLPSDIHTIICNDGTLTYENNFIDRSIQSLTHELIWRNDLITMFGKTYPQPRQTAWYGDQNISYSYSKIKMQTQIWTPELYEIKNMLEEKLQCPFNSVLINLYRDGEDHMSFHSDDEIELGLNPTIASLSFGATRRFHLKHKFNKNIETIIMPVEHGSLIVMRGELQHFWQHKIAKTKASIGPRLNLTFRNIIF
jgi:alkylated DNA repair dioxygenase AlkB